MNFLKVRSISRWRRNIMFCQKLVCRVQVQEHKEEQAPISTDADKLTAFQQTVLEANQSPKSACSHRKALHQVLGHKQEYHIFSSPCVLCSTIWFFNEQLQQAQSITLSWVKQKILDQLLPTGSPLHISRKKKYIALSCLVLMEDTASPGSSSYLCQMCLGEWPHRTLALASFSMDMAPRTIWNQRYRICGGFSQLWMCLAHCSSFCKHCEPLSFQASPSAPFLFSVKGFHAQPKSPAYTRYTYQGT